MLFETNEGYFRLMRQSPEQQNNGFALIFALASKFARLPHKSFGGLRVLKQARKLELNA